MLLSFFIKHFLQIINEIIKYHLSLSFELKIMISKEVIYIYYFILDINIIFNN